MGANGGSRLLSRDSQHWHVVQPCVVKTSEQVRRTRTGCRQAHAQFASELGVGRRHKGRHLFMPDLHELKLVARTIKRTQKTIYAVSGIPEDAPHAPLVQTIPKEITSGLRHCEYLPFRCGNLKG